MWSTAASPNTALIRDAGQHGALVLTRYNFVAPLKRPRQADVVPLGEVPFAAVEASDAAVFPARRPAFVSAWINSPGHVGRAIMHDGRLAAWGVIRPCERATRSAH